MDTVTVAIPEVDGVDERDAFELAARYEHPVVIRGLASHWPLVRKSRISNTEVGTYLQQFYNGDPVTAFVSEDDTGGRIFYTDDLREYNFTQIKTELGTVLERIARIEAGESAGTIYMGSSAIDRFLPGLGERNSLPRDGVPATVRIWLGNRTVVAAHYDVLDNVACVCAGHRRFTVFPPDQLENLYVGPIDFTPAGQAVSLVDLHDPDLGRYPRFATALEHAQTAVLEPGDAIFIPSMWWHHVEGLDSLNILINHWWRDVPAYMGAPLDALLHSILEIRDLPARQRTAWRTLFDHYVFDADPGKFSHIPDEKRGVTGTLDDDTVRRLRMLLRNKLNR